MDSRLMQLSLEQLPLGYIVRSEMQRFSSAVIERKLTVTLNNLSDLPIIEADNESLRKVFTHLISNAIKYTPDGGTITITGKVLEPGEYGLEEGVLISVADNGIGIDPQMRELIFASFFQTGEVSLHSSSKTKYKGGGPGLGLTIARGIVHAHHGQIWVESGGHDEDVCPGSIFYVALPVHQPKGQKEEA
jgi:signal transduction histidine kinase